MIQIGIDTSILVGLLDPKDKWHAASVRLQQSLQERQIEVVVFDCVVAEAISAIVRRMQEQGRLAEFPEVATRILSEYPVEEILWILPDVPDFYNEIFALMQSSQGELNFNDALIALSCRERNIHYVVSFDRDFDQLSWLKRISSVKDLHESSRI